MDLVDRHRADETRRATALGSFALVGVEEMRALERAAFDAGLSEAQLQEEAGSSVFTMVAMREANSAHVAILVGSGNNGRDGMVAGRFLREAGFEVELHLTTRHALTAEELTSLQAMGVATYPLDPGILRERLPRADCVIDALLGIGARGAPRSEQASVIRWSNELRKLSQRRWVLAVDVPSGLNADDGSTPGEVIQADVTVTFGAVKSGLIRFPGANSVGLLVPRAISILPTLSSSLPFQILDNRVATRLLPSRPLDAHKYRFGRVLVVAGSDQYVGAAVLCSSAAARSGAGLVAVASTDDVRRVVAGRLPEATYPAPGLDTQGDPVMAADRVAELLPGHSVLLIGPGIGRSEATATFLRRLLVMNARQTRLTPAVIDADALSLLAEWPAWWEQIGTGHIITPHSGEMDRLLEGVGQSAENVPWATAQAFSRATRQVTVLKGPFTSVADPMGHTWVYPRANAALATAGTGDVLAGLCAGFVSQGLSGADAASLAVTVHAEAASHVISRGRRTLLASDLLDEIPGVLSSLAS